MAKLFLAMYPLASLAYIIGYIPQILKLINAKSKPKNVSLSSWAVWFAGNIITLGYVHYHLSDWMMVLTTGLCLFLSLSVIGLTYYNMNYRFCSSCN